MIAILILAAGQSARMRGADKLGELIDGVPLLRVQALRALATGAPVFVALPSKLHARNAYLDGLDVRPIYVSGADQGIGVTLRESVASLPPCDGFLIHLADLIDVETADFLALIAACETQPDHDVWRGTTQTGKPGHPIVFASHLRRAFADMAGDHGGGAVLKDPHLRICHVPLPDDHALRDLDTPEDWAAWRANKAKGLP